MGTILLMSLKVSIARVQWDFLLKIGTLRAKDIRKNPLILSYVKYERKLLVLKTLWPIKTSLNFVQFQLKNHDSKTDFQWSKIQLASQNIINWSLI